MSDLVINTRQISNYPALTASNGNEAVLVQQNGLGGPYASISTAALVQTALASSCMGVGAGPVPADALAGQVFAQRFSMVPTGTLMWNSYADTSGVARYWANGLAALFEWNPALGWFWGQSPSGTAGAPTTPVTMMDLSIAGALSLPFGTLTVARDPSSALEVATMGWVGNNTVASFNARNGAVTLQSNDIYSALGLCYPIATEQWVTDAINASLQSLLMTCPFVNRFNNRTGSVQLMLSDITCVFFQGGQQPISPTPPPTSNDNSIATTAWVTQLLAGGESNFATQAWVLANTVNSFNGRTGAVTLSLADITQVGGAPLNSPQLSGVPTAPTQPTGNAGAAIATTAFVWNAVQESTTGVISWNGRTGVVDLTGTDINDAGGALLSSPAFSGTPTAPTAPTGTTTTQLATCAFVLNEVQAIGAGVTTFNTRSGNVVLELADITAAGGAPIASPAFSGNPTTPTPASPVAATTSIANTNWVVQYNALNTVASFNTRIGAVTLNANDITGAGGLANPNVALTGAPTAPTLVPGTNNTGIATTAFVTQAIQNIGGVTVSPSPPASPFTGQAWFNSTVSVQQLNIWTGAAWTPSTNLTMYAPLASPTFSGTPTVPTATPGTNTTQAASTAFVTAAVAAMPAPVAENYIDNSGFTVNQRNYVSGNALAAGVFGLDRWKGGPAAGGTISFSYTSVSVVVTITAGSIQQAVDNASLIAGTTYTLSWQGTAQGRIASTSGGGSYAASPLQFTPVVGNNAYIEFTGGTVSQVKLQLGTVATPWQPQPVAIELERCQRFALWNLTHIMYGYGIAGDNAGMSQTLPTTMRTTPTVTVLQWSGSNIGSGLALTASQWAFWTQGTVGATGTWTIAYALAFSADI